jgi:hypothetical protein
VTEGVHVRAFMLQKSVQAQHYAYFMHMVMTPLEAISNLIHEILIGAFGSLKLFMIFCSLFVFLLDIFFAACFLRGRVYLN